MLVMYMNVNRHVPQVFNLSMDVVCNKDFTMSDRLLHLKSKLALTLSMYYFKVNHPADPVLDAIHYLKRCTILLSGNKPDKYSGLFIVYGKDIPGSNSVDIKYLWYMDKQYDCPYTVNQLFNYGCNMYDHYYRGPSVIKIHTEVTPDVFKSFAGICI